MKHYKKNWEILEEFDSRVEGHTEAKKALINLVNRSKIRHHQRFIQQLHKDYLIDPANCLLIGGSGTGKTFLVETLQDIVPFPLIKIDATKLNPTGAGDGGIKSADLVNLIINNAKILAAQGRGYYHSEEGVIDQTVVFIDEIDKLANAWESSGKWNQQVQANFLTLFENRGRFAGVSFIFAGAFSGIENVKLTSKVNSSNGIGFNADISKKEATDDCLDEAVVKYGLLPELVGRINHIVKLDKFTRKEYRDILMNRLVPKKIEELIYFHCLGFDLTEEDIERILDKVEASGQGVRYLKRELDRHIRDIEFNYERVDEPKEQRLLSFPGNIYEGMEDENTSN